jgi:hypothetical protein
MAKANAGLQQDRTLACDKRCGPTVLLLLLQEMEAEKSKLR